MLRRVMSCPIHSCWFIIVSIWWRHAASLYRFLGGKVLDCTVYRFRVNFCCPTPTRPFLVPGPAGPITIFFCLTTLSHEALKARISVKWSRLDWYKYISDNQDSSVAAATGYGMDDRGLILGRVKRFFSTSQRPDRLWIPQAPYPMGTRFCFPGGKAAGTWSWPLTSN
jgi:hypothetical protein